MNNKLMKCLILMKKRQSIGKLKTKTMTEQAAWLSLKSEERLKIVFHIYFLKDNLTSYKVTDLRRNKLRL